MPLAHFNQEISMQKANLFLHCGSQLATREQIESSAVYTPKPTATWYPINHHQFLNGVESTLQRSGMTIVTQAHGLSHDCKRYFGLLQVANNENGDGGATASDFGLVVGLRNSHDKSYPVGLVVGASIFICDNLSFCGEIRLSRKHTVNVARDLPALLDRAVGRLGDLRRSQQQRFDAYKNVHLTDGQAHDIVVRALDARVAPVTRLPAILKEWRSPRHAEFSDRTAWSLFNSFTEILKGQLGVLPARTAALHGILDATCGLQFTKA
jgi:hypothetical protein